MIKIKLFNTLTKKKEYLNFNFNKNLNIYSCGPTVYDYIHIGNARALIVIDLLIRFFELNNLVVNHVQNFTDIDDKIIKKALENKTTEKKITNFYIKCFYKTVFNDLKLRIPNRIVKISDYISQMIDFINNLLEKKFAYISNGNVYFDINNKYNFKYYILSNKIINNLNLNFRVDFDNNKKNQSDFVLWKTKTIGINYDSPWGKGRPGWHTECVVIIDHFFKGRTIDIHSGGIDLIFPHHENERIQYLAKNDKEISKVWFHNGHLNINNLKMSKSLNNFIFVKDFLKKYNSNILKYIFYSVNYFNSLNITNEIINFSINKINKIFILLKKINIYLFENKININFKKYGIFFKRINKQLCDNLNSSNSLLILDNLLKIININIKNNQKLSFTFLNDFYIIIFKLLNFSFNLPKINFKIMNLINKWKILKRNKKYEKSDKIRKILIKLNIL